MNSFHQTKNVKKPPSPISRPPYLNLSPEGVILDLRVQPGARKTEWAGLYGRQLKLMVQAPPVEGSANQACITFLAHCFGVRRSEVMLLRGEKSRSKVFLVKGLTLEKCLSLIPGQNPDLRE